MWCKFLWLSTQNSAILQRLFWKTSFSFNPHLIYNILVRVSSHANVSQWKYVHYTNAVVFACDLCYGDVAQVYVTKQVYVTVIFTGVWRKFLWLSTQNSARLQRLFWKTSFSFNPHLIYYILVRVSNHANVSQWKYLHYTKAVAFARDLYYGDHSA